MNSIRRVRRVSRSRRTVEGAGVNLKRAFGFNEVPLFDPFLLLDDLHSNNPDDYVRGFPWHPHRGIETITYVLHGEVEHGDSMENKGLIRSGDVQWMTAGSGIIHQEMPKGQKDGLMWGFQLWANLPGSHKMMPPRYRDATKSQIPEVATETGASVRIICGQFGAAKGPIHDIVIDPEYLDVRVPSRSQFRHTVVRGKTLLAYVIEGAGCFDDQCDPYAFEAIGANYFDLQRDYLLGPEYLATFSDGEEVIVSTRDQPVRFLLISGRPIREPVAWYGPIVMNTQQELRIAFDEYRKGTFIKHTKKLQ